MRKFLIILIVLLFISIGGSAFFLSSAEKKINSLGYQPAQRRITPQKIIWEDLSHPTQPIQSLTLYLWRFPFNIVVDGINITDLPSRESNAPQVTAFTFPAADIKIKNLNISLKNFPPVRNLQGSFSPEINLWNENLKIQKKGGDWNISGTIPFEHPNISTVLEFSLLGKDLNLNMHQPRISHVLLKKDYTLPDIPWKGTLEKNDIVLHSQLEQTQIKISIQPNYSIPKQSSISLQSQISFSDLIEWFDIKNTLRPKKFSVQGYLFLELDWEKESLKHLNFDTKELNVFGDIIPSEQLKNIGISYRPIHANTARILGVSSPDWVSYSQLGWLREAVIAGEDSQFRTHDGLNRKGIIDALTKSELKDFSSGGSSITQQLVKNIFLHQERTFERKLTELLFTIAMEKQLSKEAILSLYLNAVEFGPNIYGAKQACSYYFMKSPQNITIREAAFLVAILPNPLEGNRDALRSKIPSYKINQIIENMYNGKDITQQQLISAKSDSLQLLMPQNASP